MKERPIIMSGDSVRAILAGRKTQTRRAVKHRDLTFLGGKGCEDDPDGWGWFFDGPDHNGYMVLGRGHDERHDNGLISIRSPYGEAGDRLWVKETWSKDALTVYPCPPIWYRADFSPHYLGEMRNKEHARHCDAPKTGRATGECFACAGGVRWRSPLFMGHRDSRLTLLVTSVRVERVQAISEGDAKAEGVVTVSDHCQWLDDRREPYRAGYARAWDKINGKTHPWSANPWVWAVTFEVVP